MDSDRVMIVTEKQRAATSPEVMGVPRVPPAYSRRMWVLIEGAAPRGLGEVTGEVYVLTPKTATFLISDMVGVEGGLNEQINKQL